MTGEDIEITAGWLLPDILQGFYFLVFLFFVEKKLNQ